MMKINWNYPTSVWVGENRVKDLSEACKNLSISKPLFVTDKDLINLEMVKNIILDLRQNYNNMSIFSNFSGNPIGENVEEGVEVESTFGDEEDEEEDDESEIEKSDEKSLIKRILKDPEQRKKAMFGIVGLLALLLLLPTEDTKDKRSKKVRSPASKIKKKKEKRKKDIYTKEQKEFLEGNYLLSQTLYEQGKYRETIRVLESVFQTTKGKDYKNAKQIRSLAKKGLAELEEIERKRKVEEKKCLNYFHKFCLYKRM